MSSVQNASMIDGNFEEFYAAYPRKKNPHMARQKYIAALKHATHTQIMAGLEAYKREIEREGTEKKFICWPQTWLHQRRWDNPEDMTPERKGWVPVEKMTDAEKRRLADMLKHPAMKPHMLRLGPRSIEQLKAEGYL